MSNCSGRPLNFTANIFGYGTMYFSEMLLLPYEWNMAPDVDISKFVGFEMLTLFLPVRVIISLVLKWSSDIVIESRSLTSVRLLTLLRLAAGGVPLMIASDIELFLELFAVFVLANWELRLWRWWFEKFLPMNPSSSSLGRVVSWLEVRSEGKKCCKSRLLLIKYLLLVHEAK